MAGKIVENGGISGYYALAAIAATLLVTAGVMSAEAESEKRPKRPKKAKKRRSKAVRAITSRRRSRGNRSPDKALLRERYDDIEKRLKALRSKPYKAGDNPHGEALDAHLASAFPEEQ